MFSARGGFLSSGGNDDLVYTINISNISNPYSLRITNGSYDIDWGDGNIQSTNNLGSHYYASPGSYLIRISNIVTTISPASLTLDIAEGVLDKPLITSFRQWGNAQWTILGDAFDDCINMVNYAADTPNISATTGIDFMFYNCSLFDGNLAAWNTGNVVNMTSTFRNATTFNGNIVTWNTAKVTNMQTMFTNAISFNQNIGSWNTANVTNMGSMFLNATSFNQNLSNWDVSKVTNFTSTFKNASSFNQSLGNWNLKRSGIPLPTLTSMLDDCGIDTENYSKTLIGWANYVATYGGPQNRTLGANGRTYNNTNYGGSPYNNAVSARNFLTTSRGWVISGDSFV